MVPFVSIVTVPFAGVVVVSVPVVGKSESLSKIGMTARVSSSNVTTSSTKVAPCVIHTTVKRGKSLLLPALVIVATYRSTEVVLVTTGLVWSPPTAGLQFILAPEGTLAEISKVT